MVLLLSREYVKQYVLLTFNLEEYLYADTCLSYCTNLLALSIVPRMSAGNLCFSSERDIRERAER
jgi:hypothetical protein